MILTPQDQEVYFPNYCGEGSTLLGAIRITESIAQSPEGSNRYLEITDYQEEKQLSVFDRSILLSYYPIVPSSLVVSTIRVQGKDGFGRRVSVDKRTLTSSEYYLENDVLYITNPAFIHKLSVKYRAGFDFTIDTPDTITIKSALGSLLEYRASFVGQGLTRHDGLGVSLNAPQVGSNPENLMNIFRQYRPRN